MSAFTTIDPQVGEKEEEKTSSSSPSSSSAPAHASPTTRATVDEKEPIPVPTSDSKTSPRKQTMTFHSEKKVTTGQALQIVKDTLEQIHDGAEFSHAYIPHAKEHEDGVVYYELIIGTDTARWSLLKRYQEFHQLNQEIESRVSSVGILPPFPTRKIRWFTNHADPEFVETRRVLLENYIKKLIVSPSLRTSRTFLDFLCPGDDDQVATADAVETLPPIPLLPPEPAYVSDEVTAVSVPSAQVLRQDHVVYQVNVENQRKRSSFSRWTVLKRYVDFYQLDTSIRKALKDIGLLSVLSEMPTLPGRQSKFLIDHLQLRFIEKRRLKLELYLRKLITLPDVIGLACVLRFLGCDQ